MKDNKRLKRRVRNSYIVSTVSMALVLFLLGSVGYLMTAALRVARTLQESVTVTVELADGVDSLRRGEIERRLRGDEMVRDIEFVSKQTKIGDAEFRHMFENEIEEVLGENPLNDSFEVHLSAESADSVRLDAFMAKAGGMRGVERATCPLPMIRRMHATSLDGIGKEFGNRDHSTILHSLDKVEKQMQTDPKFAERVKEITTNISSKR